MSDFPFNDPLDGMVGNIDGPDTPAAVAHKATTESTPPKLWVAATGDGISNPALLSEDLKFLVAEFMCRLGERKVARSHASHSEPQGDIEITLHGLNLDPADQHELRRLIDERVRAHPKHREAGK